MKLKAFITIIFLSVTFSGITQNVPALMGTWKMVSGTTTEGDSTTTNDMTGAERMKLVTPTHFAFLAIDMTGHIVGAFGGKVKMDGNNYTEIIMYSIGTGDPSPTTSKFTYELNGDKWHIKGGYDKYIFDEIWQRVQ